MTIETRTRRRLSWWTIGLLAGVLALPTLVEAQIGVTTKMTRTTSTSGLNDSALVAVVDSAKLTRAATVAQLRKTLARKAFDSIRVTAQSNLLGRTTIGDSLITLAVRPTADNATGLGTSAFRWSDVRANTATFSGAVATGALTPSSLTVNAGTGSAIANVRTTADATAALSLERSGTSTFNFLVAATAPTNLRTGSMYIQPAVGNTDIGLVTSGGTAAFVFNGTSGVTNSTGFDGPALDIFTTLANATAQTFTHRAASFTTNTGSSIPGISWWSSSMVRWTNGVDGTDGGNGGAADLGLGRNAAGVLEVNSGTAGTLRDVTARNVKTIGLSETTVDTTITTTVSYSPNYTTKSFQGITLSANTTQTIGAPTAPTGAGATALTHVFIRIKNTSGGAITNAVVWNAVFHFASATAPANPATGTHYIVEFLTDGTTYWELTRAIAIAN